MPKKIEFGDFFRSLESGKKPACAYLFYGPEEYLHRQSRQIIKDQVLGIKEFNQQEFVCPGDSVSTVIEALQTMPLGAPFRLVIYENVHQLRAEDWAELQAAIQKGNPYAVLVMTAEKVDQRKKVFKQLIKDVCFVELKKPYDNQIPKWIHYIANQQGAKITSEACDVFQGFSNQSLSEIEMELKKLVAYKKNNKSSSPEDLTIETDDVIQAASNSKRNDVFELARSIGFKQREDALVQLDNLLKFRTNEFFLVSMIYRHLNILKVLKRSLQEGLADRELSSKAGISPYFLRDYKGQTQLWKPEELVNATASLHEADRAIKTGALLPKSFLEKLILNHSSS